MGAHPEGVLIVVGGSVGESLLLNGEKLIYEGQFEELIFAHPRGILTQRENSFFLDGKKIYEGTQHNFRVHNDGIIVRCGNRFLLNGEKLLYEGDFRAWQPHPEGVAIERDDGIFLNGEKLLYKEAYGYVPGWNIHPDGIVIEQEGKLLLNEETLLYEGEYEEYGFHPEGIIIVNDCKFLLFPTKK